MNLQVSNHVALPTDVEESLVSKIESTGKKMTDQAWALGFRVLGFRVLVSDLGFTV